MISTNHRRLASALLLAALLAACASPGREPELSAASPVQEVSVPKDRVAAFSAARPDGPLPSGWQQWVLHPTKRRTVYSVVADTGVPVLRAVADASASGLITQLDVDLQRSPLLEWRWRAESLIAGADNAVAATEDAPLRVVLAFDGDKTTLSLRERLFAERVKLISGRELPYASLMYIWANQAPKETLIDNPHSERIKKLVVDTGAARLGQWRMHRRNVVEDYQRAFGKLPGRLIAIGIMTDTDNTGSQVAAYYGDIQLGTIQPVPADKNASSP